MFSYHLWILLSASLAAVSASLLGVFLLLRRQSLLGDAISHAVLPGLVLAFLWTGERNSFLMFLGAAVCALLTAVLAEFLTRYSRVDQGAALGVVFTSLFALGVLLLSSMADKIDLDPSCVLYGSLEYTPLNVVKLAGYEVPRSVCVLLPTFVLLTGFVAAFYKELKIVCFDPDYARTLGIRSAWISFSFLILVALLSVATFEAVGSILLVAMLVIPPASARLLSDRLLSTILYAVFFALLSAAFGYYFAFSLNTSVAGMMATVAGAIFALLFLLAPEYGLLGRLLRRSPKA